MEFKMEIQHLYNHNQDSHVENMIFDFHSPFNQMCIQLPVHCDGPSCYCGMSIVDKRNVDGAV